MNGYIIDVIFSLLTLVIGLVLTYVVWRFAFRHAMRDSRQEIERELADNASHYGIPQNFVASPSAFSHIRPFENAPHASA